MSECHVNKYSSRICEHGTKCCTVSHTPSIPKDKLKALVAEWKDNNDTVYHLAYKECADQLQALIDEVE